jgi:hypothetical protein
MRASGLHTLCARRMCLRDTLPEKPPAPIVAAARADLDELRKGQEPLHDRLRKPVFEPAGPFFRKFLFEAQQIAEKALEHFVLLDDFLRLAAPGSGQRDHLVWGVVDVPPLGQRSQGARDRGGADAERAGDIFGSCRTFLRLDPEDRLEVILQTRAQLRLTITHGHPHSSAKPELSQRRIACQPARRGRRSTAAARFSISATAPPGPTH